MRKKIRLLVIEDSEDDKDLLLLHLKRGGFDITSRRVDNREDLKDTLDSEPWDLIISDYFMPAFNGISALKIVKESGLDIPFILVSGAVGEEIAVEAMKAGAHDFFMKDNLTRLIPAIERELREAKNRSEHRKIEQQRQRLEQLVQQSLNEIYIFDSNTLQFEYANESTLRNLGYTHEELMQRTPLDLKKEYDRTSFFHDLHPLLDGSKQKIVLNTFHQRKDGTEYPVEAHVQIIEEGDRKLFTATILDLTSHKRSENIISKQKKLAKQLALNSKYKSEFLANMSHEFRTPLNSIILLSKLLRKKKDSFSNKGQVEYVDEIYKSAHSLMSLINDVLDVSKIEAGEMSFNVKELKVSEWFSNITGSFKLLAEDKGLQFTIKNNVDSDFTMLTDPLRVEQILKNFYSNAIKFTEDGFITATVYLPTEKEYSHLNLRETEVIAFSVKDSGIGINKKDRRNIFEAFQQVDSSAERKFKGTGLGLSISKQITKSLGGAISLESSPGMGSTFTVYLPVNSSTCIEEKNFKVESIQKLVSRSAPNLHSFSLETGVPVAVSDTIDSDFKILLADDSELHVTALKELIDSENKTCLIANTAKETYTILEQSNPDLLVLDLGLPDADGFDVIKRVRETYSSKHLPIIVYSGRDLSSTIKNKFSELVNSFVTKTSGSFKVLNDTIDALLTPGKDPSLQQNELNEHFLLENKRILIIDDDERNLYSLSKSLEEYSFQLFTGKNGLEALNFLETNEVPDLILMDIMMPKMNGLDAISKIEENNIWAQIPIIAVTAKATPKDRIKCLEAGASDYVSKPIDIDYLISKMIHWLKKHS